MVELCCVIVAGELNIVDIEIDECLVVSVILVLGGYLGSYEKGKIIIGLDVVSGSLVFYVGIKNVDDGCFVINGGCVLVIIFYGVIF